MSAPRLKLEVFETEADGARTTVLIDGEDLEDTRLAAFEQGYRAGWDDANAAQTDDERKIRMAVVQTLSGLAAQQSDARQHVLAALRPLLETIIGAFLPRLSAAALPSQIADALGPYAELASEAPVDLFVNPAAVATVESFLIEAAGNLALQINEDPSLGPGQAILRFGQAETRIDLDGAISRISGLMADFYAQSEQEKAHG